MNKNDGEFKDTSGEVLSNFKIHLDKSLSDIGSKIVNKTMKKLRGEYLSVKSGRLMGSITFIKTIDSVFTVIGSWYGVAYETGKWNLFKGFDDSGSENYQMYKKIKQNHSTKFKGKKHRPFMIDTIKENTNFIKKTFKKYLKVK